MGVEWRFIKIDFKKISEFAISLLNFERKTMKRILLIFAMCLLVIVVFSQTTIIMNKEGGVYTVPCKVNGLKLKFIFDTGASNVSISLTEAIFMIKNDYLDQKDIYGTSYARLANGDIAENTEILLREIEIGGLKLYNIKASVVHELAAPLLLGQSAIEKLGVIQLDGNKLTIIKRGNNTTYNRPVTSKPASTNTTKSRSSSDVDSKTVEVFTCSVIYDRPDEKNGKQIKKACSGRVAVISKVNDKYYKVKYEGAIGYIHSKWIKE
jgi:clan AA aspartic protease (TIGR02281 family)